jgi:isocitrate lyase
MNNVWRPTKEQVNLVRGSFIQDYSLAKKTSKKLRELLLSEKYIAALGCMSGHQAVQCAKAGLKSVYVSGWMVASEANTIGQVYPDMSLYPSNSVPEMVKKINNALTRADQIDWSENGGKSTKDFFLPQICDLEAAFGAELSAFELTKLAIEAGTAGFHLEDQLSSVKKCGHNSGKVLVPASEFIRKLKAARLAAEVCGVDTVIIARTDANSAKLLTTDIDKEDHNFMLSVENTLTPDRTSEGFYHITGGLDMAINRGVQYAPYADLLWMETSTPDLDEAKEFAKRIHEKFPGKWLAYNCSPSFNWGKKFSMKECENFQGELGDLGYKFQFVTLAGFHSLNSSMFDLAESYKTRGMGAYRNLQDMEFDDQARGYTAVKHQREVGTNYFDLVLQTISEGKSSTLASISSTEKEQF